MPIIANSSLRPLGGKADKISEDLSGGGMFLAGPRVDCVRSREVLSVSRDDFQADATANGGDEGIVKTKRVVFCLSHETAPFESGGLIKNQDCSSKILQDELEVAL